MKEKEEELERKNLGGNDGGLGGNKRGKQKKVMRRERNGRRRKRELMRWKDIISSLGA